MRDQSQQILNLLVPSNLHFFASCMMQNSSWEAQSSGTHPCLSVTREEKHFPFLLIAKLP